MASGTTCHEAFHEAANPFYLLLETFILPRVPPRSSIVLCIRKCFTRYELRQQDDDWLIRATTKHTMEAF